MVVFRGFSLDFAENHSSSEEGDIGRSQKSKGKGFSKIPPRNLLIVFFLLFLASLLVIHFITKEKFGDDDRIENTFENREMDYYMTYSSGDVTGEPDKFVSPLFNITLLYNTNICFIDCYADVEVDWNADLTFDVSNVEQFNNYYIKSKDALDLREFGIKEKINTSYIKEEWVSDIICNPYEESGKNGTYIVENCSDYGEYINKQIGNYDYTNFDGIKQVKKGDKTYLKIYGKKEPKLGKNNVDWQLCMNNYCVPFAWWNTNWGARKSITVESNTSFTDDPIVVNITGLNLTQNNCSKELVILDNSSNQVERVILDDTSQAVGDGSESCLVQFPMAKNANENQTYYAYYNSSTADETANQKPMIWGSNFDNMYENNWDSYSGTSTKSLYSPNKLDWSCSANAYSFDYNVNSSAIDKATVEIRVKFNSGTAAGLEYFRNTYGGIYCFDANKFAGDSDGDIECADETGLAIDMTKWQIIRLVTHNLSGAGGQDYDSSEIWANHYFYDNPTNNVTDTGYGNPWETLPFKNDIMIRSFTGALNVSFDYAYVSSGYKYPPSKIILGTVELPNVVPTTPDVIFDVSIAYNNTDLNLSVGTYINDADGDNMTVNFTVNVNGVYRLNLSLSEQLNGSQPSFVIHHENYSKNDNVTGYITLFDGIGYSATNSTSIIISNSAPNAPNITFPFNDTYQNNLTVVIGNSSDIDNDNLNFTLQVSNLSNFSSSNIVYYNSTILDNYRQVHLDLADGTYYLRALAFDGTSNSSWSENVTVKYDTTSPSLIFKSQEPSDINSFNVFGQEGLNITYNISDLGIGVDTSTIKLYFKTNSSVSDTFFYLNGTKFDGYLDSGYNLTNISSNWTFNLLDNLVYPATYNVNETIMEDTNHLAYDLDTSGEYAYNEFFNVSNKKDYTFLEVMVDNQTADSPPLRFYYCNESYISGTIITNTNCVNFYNLDASTSFNHTHRGGKANHTIITMAINATTGMVGNVHVTNTSKILVRGGGGVNGWNYYYISNISRIDAYKISANGGVSYTNFSGSFDIHIHQYDGSEKYHYYSCANDSLGYSNCSIWRYDLIDLLGIPPNAPDVYNPTSDYYNGFITINYTESISPNSYPIVLYNISLVDVNFNYVQSIQSNNSINLSYIWNSSLANDGQYYIRVEACDNYTQCSFGYSENITIDNTAPDIIIINPLNITYNRILNNYSLNLNISVSNDTIACNYSLNGASNVSMNQENLKNWSNVFDSAVSGNRIVVTCNDNLNYNSTSISWYLNVIPNITSVIINTTFGLNTTIENITAYLEYVDSNNDSVYFSYDWRINGKSDNVLNLPFNINGSNDNTSLVNDYTTYNNDGSLGNGSTTSKPHWNNSCSNNLGSCYEFDGLDDSIDFGNPSSLQLDVPFAISVWVNSKDTSDRGYIVAKINTTSLQSGYSIFWVGDENRVYFYYNGSGYVESDAVFTDLNQWVHIVYNVRNDSNLTFYRNAQEAGSHIISYTKETGKNLIVGSRADGTLSAVHYFNGSIDNIQIWNRSLSEDEIRMIYNNGNGLYNVTHSDATGLYDSWGVAVTPSDGIYEGDIFYSINLTIRNEPPYTPSPIHVPLQVYEGYDVNVSAIYNDFENNLGMCHINVSKDDVVNFSIIITGLYNDDVCNYTVDGNNFTGGQDWSAKFVFFDYYNLSDANTTNWTILTENLYCFYTKYPSVQKDYIDIFCYHNIKSNYTCLTTIKTIDGKVINAMPYEKIDEVGYETNFQSEGHAVHLRVSNENLAPDVEFNLGVKCFDCAGSDFEYNESVTYEIPDANIVVERGVWFKNNIHYIWISFLLIVLTLIFVYLLRKR